MAKTRIKKIQFSRSDDEMIKSNSDVRNPNRLYAKEIADRIGCPVHSVYHRRLVLNSRLNKRWTAEEIELIRKYRTEDMMEIGEIADIFGSTFKAMAMLLSNHKIKKNWKTDRRGIRYHVQ